MTSESVEFGIPVGGRPFLFERLDRDAWISCEGGWLKVPLLIRVARTSEGELVCTGLMAGVSPSDPEPISARDLAGIRLGSLLAQLAPVLGDGRKSRYLKEGALSTPEDFRDLLGKVTVDRPRQGPKLPGRHQLTPEWFQKVADIYREVLAESPERPTQALARKTSVSTRTASRWITRAKEMGLIDDDDKAGENQ